MTKTVIDLVEYRAMRATVQKNQLKMPMVVIRNSRVGCSDLRIVPMNEIEKRSVKAMVSYAATRMRLSEGTIRALIAKHCDKSDFAKVEDDRSQFDRAIEFLTHVVDTL